MRNPGKIRNKIKRTEVFAKYKKVKQKIKKKIKAEHVKEIEELGDAAPPKQVRMYCTDILMFLIY